MYCRPIGWGGIFGGETFLGGVGAGAGGTSSLGSVACGGVTWGACGVYGGRGVALLSGWNCGTRGDVGVGTGANLMMALDLFNVFMLWLINLRPSAWVLEGRLGTIKCGTWTRGGVASGGGVGGGGGSGGLLGAPHNLGGGAGVNWTCPGTVQALGISQAMPSWCSGFLCGSMGLLAPMDVRDRQSFLFCS